MRIYHKLLLGSAALAAAALATTYVTTKTPGIYPPAFAVGATNPQVTEDNIKTTICVKGWTATIRPPAAYTSPLKAMQLKMLGYFDQNPSDYEEDHLISLELGGNPTDQHNLYPEPYHPQGHPDGGAKFKDQVENYLKGEVCAGRMSLFVAQRLIVKSWYQVYQDKIAHSLGASNQLSDEDDQ